MNMSCCNSCCGCCYPGEYELRKVESKTANEVVAVFDVEPSAPELEYIDDFVGPPLMLLKPMISTLPLSIPTPFLTPPTPPPTSSSASSPPLSPSSTSPELEHIDDFVGFSLVSLQPTMSPSHSSHSTSSSKPSSTPTPPLTWPKTASAEESESPPFIISTPSVLTKPRLRYWNIRERAEQIRLFCHYLKEDYKEEMYEYGPGPDYPTLEWENKEQSAEFADLQLPYWIEEGVRLCGTAPILEHIAQKHDLLPSSKHTRTRLRRTQESIDELRGNFEDLCYDREWKAREQQFLRATPKQLHRLSSTLGNRNWISGRKINYPDFNLYDLLDMLVNFAPNCLKQFGNLENFMLRFRGLQSVKDYIATPEFLSRPFFSPKALWDGCRK
ncbi:Glutathione S-transferase Mu 6 [Taenia crassiceps]|uniref:glutathione transferase n=1 Tax=Taenia crassiceps TaxID=6207 RepID=A0ABR4Q6B4_9CEST